MHQIVKYNFEKSRTLIANSSCVKFLIQNSNMGIAKHIEIITFINLQETLGGIAKERRNGSDRDRGIVNVSEINGMHD